MSLSRSPSLNKVNNIIESSNINIKDGYLKKNYTINHFINSGAFGYVLSVSNIKTLFEKSAVKIIPFYIDKSNPERILSVRISKKLKEVRLLSKFNHPNIIEYKNSWIELGNITKDILISNLGDIQSLSYYNSFRSISNDILESSMVNRQLININIEMELMDFSLRKLIINNNNNSLLNISIIINGIISGLKYLHNKNIIHGDLKPENILININNKIEIVNVKIADFGLVIQKNSIHNTSKIGTPIYSPPEFIYGIITDKYDIYSLGIILYEMLSFFKTNMERVISIHNFLKKTIMKTQIKKKKKNIKYLDFFYNYHLKYNKMELNLFFFLKSIINNDPYLRPTLNDINDFFN